MVAPKEVLGKSYTLQGPTMLAFPQVVEAVAAPGIQGAKPRFSAWLVFDPKNPDYKALQQVAYEVGCIKLPAKFTFCRMPLTPEEEKDPEYKAKNNPGRMSPFYLGDRVIANAEAKGKSASGLQFLAGKVALVARSGEFYPPTLAKPGVQAIQDRLSAAPLFYTGALVGATVWLRVYEAFGGGVSARLNSLYATLEGERVTSSGNFDAIPFWAEEGAKKLVTSLPTTLRQQLADHLAEF